MARSKGAKSSKSISANTDSKGNGSAADAGLDGFSELGADALSNLTKRIESGLQRPTQGKAPRPPKQSNKRGDDAVKAKSADNRARPSQNEEKTLKKPTVGQPTRKEAPQTGKKRDRNGNVLPKERSGAPAKPSGKSGKDLRQEILDLGGTEEDYNLVAGLETDSEVEGEFGKQDADLRKQMSTMFKNFQPPADIQGEVPSDEESVDAASDAETKATNKVKPVVQQKAANGTEGSKESKDIPKFGGEMVRSGCFSSCCGCLPCDR